MNVFNVISRSCLLDEGTVSLGVEIVEILDDLNQLVVFRNFKRGRFFLVLRARADGEARVAFEYKSIILAIAFLANVFFRTVD